MSPFLARPIRALAFCACLAQAFATPAQAADVLVFAAASLKPALDEIIASPAARRIGAVSASYAASSQLARQIEHAAPAALFISADPEWMDHVEQRGKLVAGTRSDLLGNALVLVAPADSAVTLRIAPEFGLRGALGSDGRLAIGEPNSVPAGKYAKAALVALGVWAEVETRLAPAVNVRAALSFVARNETPLGIVYRSDAVSESAVRIVDAFPASTHPPIVYPVALVAAGDTAEARRMLDYLHSAEAATVFTRYGFDRLAR
ncbi:MAG TPA: molybdate ABC transporter substrate-binding protein [Dokdonella sp.]|jgi:molybdate transport system substrate-binding protein|nr:molybdate ABC transporter substrate-binding protein [Dokdonella sp.]